MAISAEAIRAHFDALNRGDFDGVVKSIADDFVQEWPQSGERIRGRQACLNVLKNYPGGMPTISLSRIVGAGDVWVVEGVIDYPNGNRVYTTAIIEVKDGLVVRERDYFAEPFEAPAWRAQWVERMQEPVHA